jgi:hypothetical protein
VFYDADSRSLLAQERSETLHAVFEASEHRARRWLSARLIAAGEKLHPRKCESHPERSSGRTRAAY